MSKKLTRFVLATLLGLVSTLIPQSAQAALDDLITPEGYELVTNWGGPMYLDAGSTLSKSISNAEPGVEYIWMFRVSYTYATTSEVVSATIDGKSVECTPPNSNPTAGYVGKTAAYTATGASMEFKLAASGISSSGYYYTISDVAVYKKAVPKVSYTTVSRTYNEDDGAILTISGIQNANGQTITYSIVNANTNEVVYGPCTSTLSEGATSWTSDAVKGLANGKYKFQFSIDGLASTIPNPGYSDSFSVSTPIFKIASVDVPSVMYIGKEVTVDNISINNLTSSIQKANVTLYCPELDTNVGSINFGSNLGFEPGTHNTYRVITWEGWNEVITDETQPLVMKFDFPTTAGWIELPNGEWDQKPMEPGTYHFVLKLSYYDDVNYVSCTVESSPFTVSVEEAMPEYVDLKFVSSNIPETYTITNDGAAYKVDYVFENKGATTDATISLLVNGQVKESVNQKLVWKVPVSGSFEYPFTEVGEYTIQVVAEAKDVEPVEGTSASTGDPVKVKVGADYSLIVTPEIPFNQIAGETMTVPVIVQNNGPVTANYRIMIYTQDTAFDQSAIPYGPISSLNRAPIRHLAPGKSIRIDDLESFTSSTPGDKYVAVVYRFYEGNEENDWNIQKDMFMAPAEAKRVKFSKGEPKVAVSYTIAEGKTAYVEGETISVTATLANSGNVAGITGDVILYGVQAGGKPVELAKVKPSAPIAPEASAEFTLTTAPLTADQAGEWELFVQYKTGYYSSNFTFDSAHQTVTVRAHEYGVEMVNAEGAKEIVAGNPYNVKVTLKNLEDAFENFTLTAKSSTGAIKTVEPATVTLAEDQEAEFTLTINFNEDVESIQEFGYFLYNGETLIQEVGSGSVSIITPEAPAYALENIKVDYPETLEEGTETFYVTVSFKNIGHDIEDFTLTVVGDDVAEATEEVVNLANGEEGEYTVTVTLAEELTTEGVFKGEVKLFNEEESLIGGEVIEIEITPAVEEGYEVAIDEARTVLVPAGVEKLQAGIQYVAKTVLNNLGQALKVRVDLIAMGGISILDGEGSQAAQIVGSTEVELAAGAQNVDVEIPYILQSEGDYTLSLVVTADDPAIDLNPVMIEEPVAAEVVEPEMPSLEESGLDEDTATEIKTGETWQANVYIKAENAVENWVLVAKGGNVATSNEAVVNLEAGETGNYELNITFDGTTENELGEDVFAYNMYLVNGLIEIPFLQGTVGLIPTYEYDVTIEAPEAIEANKVFNVTVNFDNKADRIRDWKANLYVGEDLIGSAAINAAAKTAVEVTVEGEVYTAGEKKFRVDVINNYGEVVKTENFTVGVTMTSVAIATEVPATAAAGKEFEVKATITNDGTEAFEAYTVELLVNDEVVKTKESTEALAAEANAEFKFTLTEQEVGDYNVAVRFTAGEYTPTSEVKKVVVEEVITVAFAAQFAETYEVGDTVATTLTVTNDSRVAVAGKLYTYAKSAETTENSPVAEAVEINLEAGESTEVPVEIKDLAEGTWYVYFILREGDYFSDVIAESGKYTINMVVTPTEVKVGDLVVKAESEVIAGEAWEATVEFANEGVAIEGYTLAAYYEGEALESVKVAAEIGGTIEHTFTINFPEEAFGPQTVSIMLFNEENEAVIEWPVNVTIVDPAPVLAGTVVAAQPAEAYVYRTIEVPVTVTNNGDVTFDSYNVYLVVDNEALILTGVAGVEPLAAGESAVVYPIFRTDEEGIYNVKAVLIANGETIDTSDEIAIDVVNAPVVREPNVTATAEFDNEIYVGETLNVTVTLKNESLPVDFKLTAAGAEVAEATEIEGSLAEGAEETYELAVKFTDEAYASVPFSVVVTVGNKVFETPLNVTIVDKPEEPRPSVEVPGLEIPVGYHGYAYWTPEEIANFQGAAGMNLNTDYLPTSFTVEGIAMGKALTSPTVSLQEGRSYLLAYFVDNRAAQNSSVKLTAWEGIEGLQIRNNAKDWTIVTVNYTAEEDKDVDVTLGFNLFSGAKATVYGLAVLESDDFVSPVIESEVNTNVAEATVRFTSEAGWNYTVETDAEGNVTLDVNNNTVYNVVAMKSAYKDSESIVWTAGPVETETLSFELEENAVNELSLFVNDDNAPYNVVLSWDAVTPGSLDPTVEYRVYNNGVHVATVNQPAAAAEMRAAGVVSYDFVGLSKGSYTFGVAAYFPASETETTVAEISYDLVSTGISMIVNDNNVEAIYDLNGRRISKENVEAGMYVIRYANGETRRVMVTK